MTTEIIVKMHNIVDKHWRKEELTEQEKIYYDKHVDDMVKFTKALMTPWIDARISKFYG